MIGERRQDGDIQKIQRRTKLSSQILACPNYILTLTRTSNTITPASTIDITNVARKTTALLHRIPWLHLEIR